MDFRLLGPVEVRANDRALPLRGHKEQALLALLVLNANRVLSPERVVDELWGDEPPETVRKMVQVYVSRLRKVLPEATLLTRPHGYVLETEPETIDVYRFERLVAEARSAGPDHAARLLREALELYRGPALAGLVDEPFFRAEGARLDDLRLAALEDRIDADLLLGREAELVDELQALVVEHPHRERLRGQLMLALYRAGRQADALAAYRDARAALDELGLEPGAELRELESLRLPERRARRPA